MPKTVKRRTKTVPREKAAEKRVEASSEERVEQSKYFVPQQVFQPTTKREFDFPQFYGDNRIVLLVRDTHWLHAYWEIIQSKYDEVRAVLGDDFVKSKEILRVYNTSTEPWKSFDMEIFGGARNWYINVPEPDRTYIVDIGYLAPDGRFLMMARSNAVTTPRDRMSDIIDEEWMTIDFERIYALSGGFGIGKSSAEIKKLMEKRLMTQKASGWVTSMSSPFGGPRERPFFLVANTELIVYGATEPTAKLFIQGKRVPLRRDGTFSFRFALPDGKQVIPIEAIRDDDAEKRSITPEVEKKTK